MTPREQQDWHARRELWILERMRVASLTVTRFPGDPGTGPVVLL